MSRDQTWELLHKVMTGLVSAAVLGLFKFVLDVKVELAEIHIQLAQANQQTAVIIEVLDTIAPRTTQ